MPGNSAGLIRAHRTITMVASADTYAGTGSGSYYASGAVPTASYIYPNDRYILADVAGFTKFTFTLSSTGTVTTPSVLFYYTNDPATAAGLNSFAGTGIWQMMAAPSEQSGTGLVANPVTVINPAGGGTTGQYMQFFAPMLAYRITTNAFTGGGSVVINMEALP